MMTKDTKKVVESTEEYREKLLKKIQGKKLPSCVVCGSKNTAEVHCGLVGASIYLASRTKKFHLRANGKPAQYYCNECQQYFDVPKKAES